MQKDILKKPYSIGTIMERVITTFSQVKNKSFNEHCESFKEMLRACPHHEISGW